MTEYLGVWCPTCQQDCIPMRDGTCGFCGNHVEEQAPAANGTPNIEEIPMDGCKIDGCANPSAGKGGPWKGMCQEHISAEMTRRHAKRTAASKPQKRTNGHKVTPPIVLLSLTVRAERVHELADRLDALRIELQSVEAQFNEALGELTEAARA